MVRVPEAKIDCSRQGKAKVGILDSKIVWSYGTFKKHHLQSWSQSVVCISTPGNCPISRDICEKNLTKKFQQEKSKKKSAHDSQGTWIIQVY